MHGNGATNHDCRTGICKHNENTDIITWRGEVWMVHRTAESQMLGPNSALHIYRLQGTSFVETARIPAPSDRDFRDPHLYVVGDTLRVKALARLSVVSVRDSDVDTVALGSGSADGVSAETPLETELVPMPSGRLMALVRTDGNDDEILGDLGPAHLRTVVCWAQPPYASFDCPQTLEGVRLDGPLVFFWRDRLLSIARKHLGADGRKRTAVYEFGGTLDGGPLTIREWGELPSAGDTSYAGAAALPDGRLIATWYAGDLGADDTWFLGMYAATDIWQAIIDPGKLK